MRVAWVHPSWRDLVIDYLSSDEQARARFLCSCSVHGALLALSSAGGQSGQRQLPLLRSDADWDALTDRVYDLAPELEEAEMIGLLDALGVAIDKLPMTPGGSEADALAGAVLSRLAVIWEAARAPIGLAPLEAWLTLAKQLSPRPAPPAIAVTWAELLPVSAPDLSDRTSLERFADWLTLAELLLGYDPILLEELGFPGRSQQHTDSFLNALEQDVRCLPTRDIDQAIRALARMSTLIRSYAKRADSVRHRLRLENAEYIYAPTGPDPTTVGGPTIPRQTGRLDVQRVLKDL